MNLDSLIIKSSASLSEALELLDGNGLGTLFVIDFGNKILGILTDGDIRRFLLKNKTLEAKASEVMNVHFESLPIDSDNSKILSRLSDKIKILPLVNSSGQVLDYASINRIRRIPIASPLLAGNELAYVTECIKTNWISSQGKYVNMFEELFSNYHENTSSVAVSNGTVALHLALKTLGVEEGDEVIVPDFTFAATINAILYTGAKPVLIDVDENTFNIDINKIQELITSKTKAIIPVHLYGQACDMDALVDIAKQNKLFVVEDCAEALGSFYKGRPLGVFGDAATFSFFGNKTITTGEGGMVLFKDVENSRKAMVLRDHGMSKEKRYWHEKVGFNYRLTNIQAAVGVAQFERLNLFVEAKRSFARKYDQTLSKYKFLKIQRNEEFVINSYWLYTFLIQEDAPFTREEFIENLSERGIETRPVFFPLHVMPPYKEFKDNREFPISLKVSNTGVSLPSSSNLSLLEVDYICDSVNDFISNYI